MIKKSFVKIFLFATCCSLSIAPLAFSEEALQSDQAAPATQDAQAADQQMTSTATMESAAVNTSAEKPVNEHVKHFIEKAIEGNALEVEAGQLAKKQSSNADIQGYGEMLVNDHTKANENLMFIAKNLGLKDVKADEVSSPKIKAQQDKLSKLSGEAFDKEFVKDAVKDHAEEAALYKKAKALKFQDEALQKYVSDTLPVIEHHLTTAKELIHKVAGEKAASDHHKK